MHLHIHSAVISLSITFNGPKSWGSVFAPIGLMWRHVSSVGDSLIQFSQGDSRRSSNANVRPKTSKTISKCKRTFTSSSSASRTLFSHCSTVTSSKITINPFPRRDPIPNLAYKDYINSIIFVWRDTFKNKNKASHKNIHIEKAVVLFNLGVIYN